ncbi:phospholipase D-like domain-containing protein [Noviherbaspirillum aerium]|uniref:MSHA biogenesis protein MshK n=1 Tax=Noviherbaspirillum aerium TaxID=2588497 RepID=UPI00124C001E|nr:MSHA biogenesis protein MshK [Noviherbaspirillum aerium]
MSKTFKTVTMAVVCAMGLSMTELAAGQGMPDPTRPPNIVSEPERVQNTGPAVPQVQSILISPTRRVATIDGRTVSVGDTVGDARVTRILESEVVLGTGKEQRVLKLFPGIEKQRAPGRRNAGQAVVHSEGKR